LQTRGWYDELGDILSAHAGSALVINKGYVEIYEYTANIRF